MQFVLLSRLPGRRVRQWQEALSEALDGAPILLGPPHDTPEADVRDGVEVAFVADPPPGLFTLWPNLRLVQSLWAGVDTLLVDPTLPDGLPIARLSDPALARSLAEFVLTHVLSLHRQLHRYRAQADLRIWQPLEQPRADERTVGIMGMGHMGSEAARIVLKAGFAVRGWSRQSSAPPRGVELFTGEDRLATFLSGTDILVNLLPLTLLTRGILDRDRLALLPSGASIVNLGRGPHLVLDDLTAALEEGRLSHAVLDVFETEPLPPDHPLWEHPSVTILPHVAAVTDARTAAGVAAANVRRFLSDGRLDGRVSRDLGY